jgi:hypothetical protein
MEPPIQFKALISIELEKGKTWKETPWLISLLIKSQALTTVKGKLGKLGGPAVRDDPTTVG